ncbi:MAG: response regulator [Bryobacterales bacterium]|nr:response regulator [Bryobacterales bacterium]
MRSLAGDTRITVGAQTSPPYYFVLADGEIDGPVYEVIQEAARRRSLPLDWVADEGGPDHALTTGAADVWPMMGRLVSRTGKYEITRSWLDLSYILVRPYACTAPHAASSEPKSVAHRGTEVTRSIVFDRYPRARKIKVSSHSGALRAACSGEADAAVVVEISTEGGPLEPPRECQARGICLNTTPLTTIGFGFGSRPGSRKARAAAVLLRTEIDRMIDDGTLGGILLRWGVSSGEIRALRAARVASERTNLLAAIALGLLVAVVVLSFVYRRLRRANDERKRVHDQLVQSQAALKVEFARRTEMEECFYQSQKMESLGRLAGGVAHDFNNLLTVINGYGEILFEETAGTPLRERTAQIVNAGQKAANLTRQLLAFSRKQVVEFKRVSLNAVVEDTTKMLRRVLGPDIELITTLDPALRVVRADTGQLGQVLLNLAVNARDALPGGGTVIIRTQNIVLDETYTAKHPEAVPGPYVQLTVTDTGVGMKPETLERIFEPFFTTKEAGRGTGLGLATVYGIVRQAQGSIAVTSRMGYGTTFSIYLPGLEGADAPENDSGEFRCARRGYETVLIVEDQDEVRNLMAETLESSGYKVLRASTPEEALTFSGAERVDLLITGLTFRGMTGKELTDSLLSVRPRLKILYTGGEGEPGGGAELLAKPFGPGSLCVKVRQLLDD